PARTGELAEQREALRLALDDAVHAVVGRADHLRGADLARAVVTLRALHPQRAIGREVRDPVRLEILLAVVGLDVALEQRVRGERADLRRLAIERERAVGV